MNQITRTKLRKLFADQDKYESLRDVAVHARVGQDLLLKTSRTNQITIIDVELAKHIEAFALGRLGGIEDQLRKEKV